MAFPDYPDGRVLIAFSADTLVWDPVTPWTALDQANPNLVTSYSIDRGRQYELDRTDTGRATVEIADPDGALDPTNVEGPHFGQIEPLKQIVLRRWNPVDETWNTRFRGWIEEFTYALDPSQRVYRLTISCVDLFEILNAIQMYPPDPAHPEYGGFGDDPTEYGGSATPGAVANLMAFAADVAGQVWFGPVDNVTDPTTPNPLGGENIDDRLNHILDQAGIPGDFRSIFSGNVVVKQASFSPGETAMSALQETVDAEWVGVSNMACERHGRIWFHGREAKFDPAGVLASALPDAWDYHAWKVGDGGYVASSPATYAHIRDFAFARGLSQVINHALATPQGIGDDDVAGQLVVDLTSIGKYGYRSWSAQNLLTKSGLVTMTTGLEETRKFAEYYVANYSAISYRVTSLGLRSIDPGSPGASENWRMLCQADISDSVEVYVTSPAGGFDGVGYFIEGIHEESRPANPDYDDVTMSFDLSPRSFFDVDPWAEE